MLQAAMQLQIGCVRVRAGEVAPGPSWTTVSGSVIGSRLTCDARGHEAVQNDALEVP